MAPGGKLTLENAADVRWVVQLRAPDAPEAVHSNEKLGRQEHAEEWRGEVNPEGLRDVGKDRRPEAPGGVHAHARQRRLERDVYVYERAGAQTGKSSQAGRIRDVEGHQHHPEPDR